MLLINIPVSGIRVSENIERTNIVVCIDIENFAPKKAMSIRPYPKPNGIVQQPLYQSMLCGFAGLALTFEMPFRRHYPRHSSETAHFHTVNDIVLYKFSKIYLEQERGRAR